MAVHRRELPILSPCDGFVPGPGASGDGGFCERCCKVVHDVSTMRAHELRRLLARAGDEGVCIAYRTRPDGTVVLRPDRAPGPAVGSLALGALAMLLAACAGHLTELDAPGEVCTDANGFEISCRDAVEGVMISVPEQDPGDEGCPIRPTAASEDDAVDDAVEGEAPLETIPETSEIDPDGEVPEGVSVGRVIELQRMQLPRSEVLRGTVVQVAVVEEPIQVETAEETATTPRRSRARRPRSRRDR